MARTGRPRRNTTPFPVRGTLGGYRDWWDDLDDHAELRARVEAAERRMLAAVRLLRLDGEEERQRQALATSRHQNGHPDR